MRTSVRILLLGEEKVGKTSLISALVSQHFSEKVPSVMHEVQIPAEESLENVVTTIVDSSSAPEDRPKVKDQILKADAIVLVYDLENPDTFEKVKAYWLPLIQATKDIPVVLVGNKVDLKRESEWGDALKKIQLEVQPLLTQFEFIHACLECSAKDSDYIQSVFYHSRKAVIYPIAPLLNMRSSSMQPAFEKALKRVFRLFDADHDGFLNDKEANGFQVHCFGVDLEKEEVQSLKQAVRKRSKEGVDPSKGFNPLGFIYLHRVFIESNRPETCWQVLRRCGYNEHIELLYPQNFQALADEYNGRIVELSTDAVKFLTAIFHQFDSDKDGVLSVEDLQELFSICPNPGIPWSQLDWPAVEDGKGSPSGLTLHGWLAQWSITTLLDLPTTLELLYCLGYRGTSFSAESAIQGFSAQPKDASKLANRSVLRCLVLGDSAAKLLLGRPSRSSTSINRSVANYVSPISGDKGRYLVMSDFDPNSQESILSNPGVLAQADVVLIVMDQGNSSSFKFALNLHERLPISVPRVYAVQTEEGKRERLLSSLEWESIKKHCRELGLSVPLLLKSKTPTCSDPQKPEEDKDNVFQVLVDVATNPRKGRVKVGGIASRLLGREAMVLSIAILSLGVGLAFWSGYLGRMNGSRLKPHIDRMVGKWRGK